MHVGTASVGSAPRIILIYQYCSTVYKECHPPFFCNLLLACQAVDVTAMVISELLEQLYIASCLATL